MGCCSSWISGWMGGWMGLLSLLFVGLLLSGIAAVAWALRQRDGRRAHPRSRPGKDPDLHQDHAGEEVVHRAGGTDDQAPGTHRAGMP